MTPNLEATNPPTVDGPIVIDIAALERRWLGINWGQLNASGALAGERVVVTLSSGHQVGGVLAVEAGCPAVYCDRDVVGGVAVHVERVAP